MKSYKIVIFIFLIITGLALLSAFFPADGIPIGNVTFRFPSLEKILTRNEAPSENVDDIMSGIDPDLEENLFSGMKDTLNFYHTIVATHPARFYFPNDDIHFFDDLFYEMNHARRSKRVIRVLHYGDSQIEMDRITSDLRIFFQSAFGGGGPGLLPIVQSIPTSSVYQYSSGDFSVYSSYGDGTRSSDKNYGIMARCHRLVGTANFTVTATKNAKLDKRLHHFNKVTLLFNDRSGHFSASLTDKKSRKVFHKNSLNEGVQSFVWQLDTPTTSISMTLSGEADIYGVMVDNGSGVNVDNIPLRGCSGTNFTLISDSILAESYRLADVGLIILQFGGNSIPGINGKKSVEGYKQRVARQIRYLSSIYPNAKILFIGPSDMSVRVDGELQTYPWLPAVNQALKEAANENGAAFWDMYSVMGGHNSMITWVNSGYAGTDYIHFSPSGATKIGTALSNSFSTMVNLYNLQQSMGESKFDEMWSEVAKSSPQK